MNSCEPWVPSTPNASLAIGLENQTGEPRGAGCMSNPPNPPGKATWPPMVREFISWSVFAPFAVWDRLLPDRSPNRAPILCIIPSAAREPLPGVALYPLGDDGGVGLDGGGISGRTPESVSASPRRDEHPSAPPIGHLSPEPRNRPGCQPPTCRARQHTNEHIIGAATPKRQST
jgi:hypothetical protein